MPRVSSDKKRSNKSDGMSSQATQNATSGSQQHLYEEDISGSNEAKSSKRLRKQTQAGTSGGRSTEPPVQSVLKSDPTASTAASRRRQSSMRLPAAPSSLQSSPMKRQNDPTTRTHLSGASRNTSNTSSSHSRQASMNGVPSFGFTASNVSNKGEQRPPSNSTDFLPSVNFDDLHSSLFSDMSDIEAFPAPGGSTFRPLDCDNIPGAAPKTRVPSIPKHPNGSLPKTRNLSGSLTGSVRRQNSGSQYLSDASREGDSGYGDKPGPAKTRRKSLFPGMSKQNVSTRAPRKSVGPGILTGNDSQVTPRRPSLAQAGLHVSSDAVTNGSSKLLGAQPMSFESSRYQKAKSFQATPRKSHESSHTPTALSAHGDIFAGSNTNSPARPRTQGSLTPSSNKRLSMLPNSAHATGLAARTISPTDARRLKRMSMMPSVPPLPFAPHTPQPDTPSSAGLPTAQSPSLIPRKSVTPTSSRTTPDHNRKSYSSGFSISSSTSYNSNNAAHASSRVTQNVSSSRLPTPKARGDNGSVGEEEFVPPVPAIPKAYESPKEEFSHAFSSFRKASINSTASASTGHYDDVSLKASQIAFNSRPQHQHPEPVTERKQSSNNASKRTLQPLRLPPLNLLPLSAPTASRIAALYDGSGSKDSSTTPPPHKKAQNLTPTTPMTASKAIGSRQFNEDASRSKPVPIRSNSSHHNVRSEAMPYRASSSSSTMLPARADSKGANARSAISPFISSSLPKTSGEYGQSRRETSNLHSIATDNRQSRLTGPRGQKARKASKDEISANRNESPVEKPTTPSFGSTLRRKLSLTRKKSGSKAQSTADSDVEMPPKPPQHDDMPPPRIPASATWNGPMTSPSPSQRSQRSRNVSNSSTVIHHERHRSNTFDANDTPKKPSKPTITTGASTTKRTTRSFLEGSVNSNGSTLREFLQEAKKQEIELDADDVLAEEEMKKLASRRKETETAAKQLDSLIKRATAKDRVSPSSALRMAKLNIFERGEIVDYKDVFFCGTQTAKKHVGDLSNSATNFGYDDERGDYNIVTGDHLSYRYEIIDVLGKGSFGQVVRCIDHKTGGLVAIKIIRNKKRFHQQALVEVDILQKLRDWDPHNRHGMVSFTQSFYFRGHLCISTELLGMNLYEFIKCHDFRGFSIKIIRRFAKQLLSSLVLLKSKRVIHCDLKPENVLLAHPARSEVKVIDFGSSCHENEKVYTYIQSRFYRSPEVILGMTYGMPIDMWSLGCILAELLTGYPIFPGENEQEQLACIMEVFGPPEKHLIEKSTRKKLFFDSLGKPRVTVSTKGKRRRPSSKSLQQALKCDDEAFLDFITRCLRWDPDRRLKPEEAAHHEFITGRPVKNNRPRTAPQTISSPIRRFNSISQTSRPLPEPPAANVKSTILSKNPASLPAHATGSPIKRAPSHRRNSTINSVASSNAGTAANLATGSKRPLNHPTLSTSALPRVASTHRSNAINGAKSSSNVDLASAAAAASLVTQRAR